MVFCSPFDETLARRGPAAVFLLDPEGLLRFNAEWTRDLWGRAPGPHPVDWRWALVTDRDTSYVQLVLVSSPSLLQEHPRAEVRLFREEAEARAAWEALGPARVAAT